MPQQGGAGQWREETSRPEASTSSIACAAVGSEIYVFSGAQRQFYRFDTGEWDTWDSADDVGEAPRAVANETHLFLHRTMLTNFGT